MDLPEEEAGQGMCGELIMSMYGTRDAAQNWEQEYTDFVTGIGLKPSMSSPRVFHNWHERAHIRVVARR